PGLVNEIPADRPPTPRLEKESPPPEIELRQRKLRIYAGMAVSVRVYPGAPVQPEGGTNLFNRRRGLPGGVVTRLLVVLAVLGLGGVVVVLLSQLNARTYRLLAENDRLVVMKGRLFPFGFDAYRPADPTLADAYAPVEL